MYTYAVAVVDDAEVVRLLLLRRMQALGLKAVACANGRELLDRIERGELFRLIMMDRSMPICNGEEATAAIRRMGILTSVTAIVGLTGETNPACLMDFQQSGCDAVFMKPLLPTDFTSIVRRYLAPFLASVDARAIVGASGAPLSSAEDRAVAERVKALDGSVPAAQSNAPLTEAETPGLLVAIAATITTLDQFKRHAATDSVRIMAPFFEAMQLLFEESVEDAAVGELRGGGEGSGSSAMDGGAAAAQDRGAGWRPRAVVGGAATEPVQWHSDSGFGDSMEESESDPDLTAFLGDFIEHMDEGADVTSRQAQVAHLGAVDGALWHLAQQHGDLAAGAGSVSALFPPEFLNIAREVRKAFAVSEPLKLEVDAIKVLVRQHSPSDIHGFTILHLRFVEVMARHTRLFVAEVFGLNLETVVEKVLQYRRMAAGGGGGDGMGGVRGSSDASAGPGAFPGDGGREPVVDPIAPLLGVSVFLAETTAVGDSAGDEGATDAHPFIAMLNFSPRRSAGDDARTPVRRESADPPADAPPRGGQSAGPAAWLASSGGGGGGAASRGAMAAAGPVVAMFILDPELSGFAGMWQIDQSLSHSAVPVFQHLGASRVMAQVLSYLTGRITVSRAADRQHVVRINVRSLAAFASHGLVFVDFDFTDKGVKPRLAGKVLSRHWLTNDGGMRLWCVTRTRRALLR